MPLAVDFGTSNTAVAVWDDVTGSSRLLFVPDAASSIYDGVQDVPVIPSLIHYTGDQGRLIGEQVLRRNVNRNPQTFRWMKRYIVNRNPGKILVCGRMISHVDAGRDFLSDVLRLALAEAGLAHDEVALTIPVEAYEHYSEWIGQVAAQAGMPDFRLVDEATAAAVGYEAQMQPGDAYVVFDYGAGSLDVAVVLMEEEMCTIGGCRCRVLGKAGADIGGCYIDALLFQHVLTANRRSQVDEDVRPITHVLLLECQRAKERLSHSEDADILVTNPETGAVLSCDLTRAGFEDLLTRHRIYAQISRVVRRAIHKAHELGYGKNEIKAVLMVGGGSHIPSIRQLLQQEFDCRVRTNSPLGAVAMGAAMLAAGVTVCDHIQHHYGIRHVDPKRGAYEYHDLIHRGTRYPTPGPIARLTIKASHRGQRHLGLAIMEMGEGGGTSCIEPLEILYDVSGAARVVTLTREQREARRMFCMNEHALMFLTAEPPARYEGEARFTVEFSVDKNKHLLITAKDLESGMTIYKEHPVVKLI